MWKLFAFGKTAFFWGGGGDMAGSGKYRMGRYSLIGVFRVLLKNSIVKPYNIVNNGVVPNLLILRA